MKIQCILVAISGMPCSSLVCLWMSIPFVVHGYVNNVINVRSFVKRKEPLPSVVRFQHGCGFDNPFRSALFSQSAETNSFSESDQILDCDIAVFGGGFGGLYAALAMSRQQPSKRCDSKRPNIVLVEPSEQFVFLPLLYDLTVGTATEAEVCPTYNDLLRNTNIRHIRATLESIPHNIQKECVTACICPVNGAKQNAVTHLRMKAGIIAVGAAPDSILAQIPGAAQYAQPFYTAAHAKQLRRLLQQLDQAENVRIAVVGGGFGGVELAASVQRRLPRAQVRLLARGPPLRNTRAEASVNAALQKLGVTVELCNVLALEDAASATTTSDPAGDTSTLVGRPKVRIRRSEWETNVPIEGEELPWDVVLWTAGSAPADPVSSSGCDALQKTSSGRLAVDATLRCLYNDNSSVPSRLWALGDCAEVTSTRGFVLPKTAQVAMQQADVVATNVAIELQAERSIAPPPPRVFAYQDLGSMLTLGGPNGAVLAPPDDATVAPLLAPLLNTASTVLGVADEVLLPRAPPIETPLSGLTLGSHGLGWTNAGNGTLAGTLTGAARRTVYAARMPTPTQRVVSLVSATVSTAAALLQEYQQQRGRR